MLKGIDVSVWQGDIDWKKVKASGIDFAVIRAGYGNSVSQKDKCFEKNMSGALCAGLQTGVYWFSYAVSAEDSEKEAEACLCVIAPFKDKLSLPIFFDYEYDSVRYGEQHGADTSKSAVTAMAVAFMDKIKSAGPDAGVYMNIDYSKTKYDMEKLAGYKLWMAYYSAENYNGAYIQQYTSCGFSDGVSGAVDLNRGYFEAPGNNKKMPEFIAGHDYKLTAPLKVRCGAGTDSLQKRREALSADGRRNSLPYPKAVLKEGTVVTALTVIKKADEIWLEIPSGFVCAYMNGEEYISAE